MVEVDDPSGEASARQAKAVGRGRRAVLDAVEKESGRGDREGRRDESSIGAECGRRCECEAGAC